MPPHAFDSIVNPCLEHLKYLKLLEQLCEQEYSSRKRSVGRKTRRGMVKYSKGEECWQRLVALYRCAAEYYCERNMGCWTHNMFIGIAIIMFPSSRLCPHATKGPSVHQRVTRHVSSQTRYESTVSAPLSPSQQSSS